MSSLSPQIDCVISFHFGLESSTHLTSLLIMHSSSSSLLSRRAATSFVSAVSGSLNASPKRPKRRRPRREGRRLSRHLLSSSSPPRRNVVLIQSHDMRTPMQFKQLDRRIGHVRTTLPSELEGVIEEGPIRSSGRRAIISPPRHNAFPLLLPFSQELTEIAQPRTSLIREPCMRTEAKR